jgi:hypothetical protein
LIVTANLRIPELALSQTRMAPYLVLKYVEKFVSDSLSLESQSIVLIYIITKMIHLARGLSIIPCQ